MKIFHFIFPFIRSLSHGIAEISHLMGMEKDVDVWTFRIADVACARG
jgi:hypothetical protein